MLQQQKIENINKITCKKLIRKRELVSLTKEFTHHTYSTLQRMESKRSRKIKSFICKGGEDSTRDKNSQKIIKCFKKHSIGQFLAAQKITISEGIFKKHLEKKMGSKALVFGTGKEKGVPDIVTYKNKKLEFYEIKPKTPKTKGEQLLRPDQIHWIKNNLTKFSIYLTYYEVDDKFIFYHSKPILLTKKNLSRYS